jgi:hypothetical protein
MYSVNQAILATWILFSSAILSDMPKLVAIVASFTLFRTITSKMTNRVAFVAAFCKQMHTPMVLVDGHKNHVTLVTGVSTRQGNVSDKSSFHRKHDGYVKLPQATHQCKKNLSKFKITS